MTRDVVTAGPDDPVRLIARRMLDRGISAVPVCGPGGEVLGMVSEGDILRPFTTERMLKRAWWLEMLAEGHSLAPEFEDYLAADGRRARDLMSSPVISAEEGTAVADIAELMVKHQIKRVPILRQGKIVGIVSRADIIRSLAGGHGL
ncbi:hypothetical protein AcidC75_03750 [Acidisoma sp. C75]